MKSLSKPRFWVAFAAAIAMLFYANVLGIGDVRVRSAVAGAVAGWLCVAWERWSAPSPGAPSRAIALSVTAAVYALVFFGDVFGIANPFLRVPLAVIAGSLAGFVVEALVGRVAHRPGLPLLAAMSLSGACWAAVPNPEAAWSAGFATAIGHFCPAWQADAVEIAREGGLHPAKTTGLGLGLSRKLTFWARRPTSAFKKVPQSPVIAARNGTICGDDYSALRNTCGLKVHCVRKGRQHPEPGNSSHQKRCGAIWPDTVCHIIRPVS